MKKKLTHPADGHYYISYDMLRYEGACRGHREQWVNHNGFGKVPVTLANLTRHCINEVDTTGNPVYWLLEHMHNNHMITNTEFQDSYMQYTGNRAEEARILMDVLLQRARREGRIQ
jgi:hypothetical protein